MRRGRCRAFTVGPANTDAVARICHRLDGIPLAIELAAARVTVLGPEEIAERLDDRFRLLAHDDPARPSRQRTLRALVDWSYRLLAPAEQQLLAQLSVFAGGFELDAVEAVCRADGQLIDLLGELVDKALVARGERDGHARLRLHETIREYAVDRLDDAEPVAARHLDWCRAMMAAADDALTGSSSTAWPDRARAELDNVRKAEDWGLAAGRAADALDLAWRSANFMQLWGLAEQCANWLARGLEATRDAPPSVDRARALVRTGDMLASRGRWSRAREYFEASLALGTELGDPARRAIALLSLADADCAQGALEPARRAAEEGLRTIRATGDRERTRWLVEMLGIIDLAAGDAAAARERFEASRAEAVALGKESLLAVTTQLLGEAEREDGDRIGARMHLEEALALATRHGERLAEGEALLSLGRLDARRAPAQPGPAGGRGLRGPAAGAQLPRRSGAGQGRARRCARSRGAARRGRGVPRDARDAAAAARARAARPPKSRARNDARRRAVRGGVRHRARTVVVRRRRRRPARAARHRAGRGPAAARGRYVGDHTGRPACAAARQQGPPVPGRPARGARP